MDAVSGKKAPQETGSASDHTYCQPCANDGKNIPPDAFCTVCMEFLCFNCARVHRNMKLTKGHALQDKSNMPSSFQVESENDHFTETCQCHTKELIKYYCPNHEALLCGDCLAEKVHSSCTIERISQVAKRYKEGAEYNSLKAGLVQMPIDIDSLSHDIQARMKFIDEERLTNINELRKFRNEINQYLDKREKELLEEIEQKKLKSQNLLSELKSNCQDIKAATEKLKAELQAQEVNNNQLFISGTRAIKELVDLQSALGDIRGKNRVPYFKFSRGPATEQMLASCTAIGRVDQEASELADQQKQLQGPGKQPYGSMHIYMSKVGCSGYPSYGSIVITYNFKEGKQEENHPNPGTSYRGITRTAYLPDNKEGRTVCRLLTEAFRRRLIFTIGRSKTTGREGVIIWNDIHHKTDHRPNTQFGYPDPTYLARVTGELACKGVNEEQINTKEQIGGHIEL